MEGNAIIWTGSAWKYQGKSKAPEQKTEEIRSKRDSM